jgi:CheY-like chemotaxis protein
MKILLAEDDTSIQAIALMSLARVGGHNVTVVNNGSEALEAAKTGTFDLILLDVMMPVMDGFEACAKLKADDKTRDIPVIFLTAKAQGYEVQKGMNAGAVGYILKPFDPMTISKQIEEVLRSHVRVA